MRKMHQTFLGFQVSFCCFAASYNLIYRFLLQQPNLILVIAHAFKDIPKMLALKTKQNKSQKLNFHDHIYLIVNAPVAFLAFRNCANL